MSFPLLESMRQRFGDLSLRTKFMSALLLTVSIPLLLVSVFFSTMYVDMSSRNASGLIRDKLHIASLVMDNSRQELLNINKAIASETLLPINLGLFLYQPIAWHLENLLEQQKLSFAVVMDDQGRVVASAHQSERLASGLKPLGAEILSAALKSGGSSFYSVLSKNYFTTPQGFPLTGSDRMLCLVSLVPIMDHADVLLGYVWIGILLGPEGPGEKHRILTSLPEELEVPFLFMDEHGLISSSFKDVPPGLPGSGKVFASLGQDLDSRIFTFDTGLASWQSSFLSLPDLDGSPAAVLGVALPDTDLVQTRIMSMLFLSLASLLVFGLSILIARFLARVLTKPILDVASATKKIISGDFDFTIANHGNDEIGQMAEDFNVMSLQLKKLIAELNHELVKHSEAEAHIRTLNDELEDRVQSRTQELTLANQALTESLDLLKKTQSDLIESEKMAALSTLVAGVAHEINTPIGNCVTAISYLGDSTREFSRRLSHDELTRKELETFLQNIRNVEEISTNGLRKAAELISFFKQVAVNPEEEKKQVINLGRYSEELLAGMHLRTRYPDHEFRNLIAPGIMIRTLPGVLYRVISNILSNAVEHAFTGDHAPGSGGFQPVVSLELRIDDTHMALIIADNGIGMRAEMSSRIFEPFYTTARNKGHVGLGLSITYNLVHKSLGGTMSCQTSPGSGSIFMIRIPVDASLAGLPHPE